MVLRSSREGVVLKFNIKNKTGRTGQAEQDRQNRTGRTGQAEQDRQNRTGRTGPAEQDRQNRTGRTGQVEQDWQNRIGKTIPGQDCQNTANITGHKKRTASTGLLGEASQRKTAGTGQAG